MTEELSPEIRSELDLSFAKIERMIMEDIAASDDRVVIHQALKHLVVTGNALIYMGPNGLKMYPLNRYVVDRDGDGNVIEIVTREKVSKKLVKNFSQITQVRFLMRYQPVAVWEEFPIPTEQMNVISILTASVKVRSGHGIRRLKGR